MRYRAKARKTPTTAVAAGSALNSGLGKSPTSFFEHRSATVHPDE
jgi:hypothetical protein